MRRFCPSCGELMEWCDADPGDPETGDSPIPAGWFCVCGASDAQPPLVMVGQGSYRRGYTPKLRGGTER